MDKQNSSGLLYIMFCRYVCVYVYVCMYVCVCLVIDLYLALWVGDRLLWELRIRQGCCIACLLKKSHEFYFLSSAP